MNQSSSISSPLASKAPPIIVDSHATGVKCDGGSDVLGHPEVFYSFDGRTEVICHYCGQRFRRNNS